MPAPSEPSAATSPSAAQRGAIVLAVAALTFSAMALCAKFVSARLPGPQVAFIRFFVGLFAVAVPLLTGRGFHPVNYGPLLLRGLLGGGSVLLYFLTIAHLPVGMATLLNSSWPVFVALFTFLFLDEPLHLRALLALLVTSLGVILVVLGGQSTHGSHAAMPLGREAVLWGLCGLASAILSAGAVTTIRSMRRHEGAWEIFFFFCLVGSAVTAVPSALVWVRPTGSELAWLVVMGLCSVLGQMGLTYALRDVRAITAGIILQLTPIATLLLGVLIFDENPSTLAWAGAVVTILGVTWGTITRS